MDCFAHQGTAAVAVCKNCAKGVCHACAIPVTNGLACSAVCAPVAEAVTQVQLTAIRNSGLQRSQPMALSLIALGITAIGVGYAYSYPKDPFGWTFVALGVVLGALTLRSVWRKR